MSEKRRNKSAAPYSTDGRRSGSSGEDDCGNIILGYIAVICAGAEIYAQIGRDLREISPYRNTMVVVHTSWHVDYVLDRSSREAKVFQAFGPVKPGASHQLIVERTEEMFEEILRLHD